MLLEEAENAPVDGEVNQKKLMDEKLVNNFSFSWNWRRNHCSVEVGCSSSLFSANWDCL